MSNPTQEILVRILTIINEMEKKKALDEKLKKEEMENNLLEDNSWEMINQFSDLREENIESKESSIPMTIVSPK